jgi:hypothetical protein
MEIDFYLRSSRLRGSAYDLLRPALWDNFFSLEGALRPYKSLT